MTAATALYVMNPATDYVIFGDELAVGMLVMPDFIGHRKHSTEDATLRANRFCRVTKLHTLPSPRPGLPAQVAFIGEWVDGYQSAFSYGVTWAWIVRRDGADDGAEVPGALTESGGAL